jgi:hypothetical protein
MRGRKGRFAKLLSIPVLAVCGFAVAATLAGVGIATVSTSTTTTSTSTTTTTTTPPGEEGCTPGFWKNHLEAWEGYSPDDTFASVFGEPLPGQPASLTLEEALNLGGGGFKALARHGVAALLNAASGIDFGLTEAGVIAAVVDAIEGEEGVEATKDMLAALNEQGCPF